MPASTSPLSETAIANLAGAMLGEAPINSFDETNPLARFMTRHFGVVRDQVLQTYPWHFALTRALLPQATTTDDDWGWDYAYLVPADCLRLLPLRQSGLLNGAVIPYELESGKIRTDEAGPLKVRYLRREADVGKWSPLAGNLLAARLALTGAMRIPGKASYYERVRAAHSDIYGEATKADSLERGSPEDIVDEYGGGYDVFSVRGVY